MNHQVQDSCCKECGLRRVCGLLGDVPCLDHEPEENETHVERPEFPTYVGSDGQEHAEY